MILNDFGFETSIIVVEHLSMILFLTNLGNETKTAAINA